MTAPSSPLPIEPLLPQLLERLETGNRLVLEAPPGAGKTTRVPLALLDAGWLADRRLIMLEPRRVAARAAAGHMAGQLGEEVGATVGYRVRHESRVSSATRIEVVTEGIATRLLQDDPALDGIGALLFDEFHERHLHSDLALALALDVQASLRPDLRLLVMSATLDGDRLAAFLEAPRLRSEGRAHPVRITHPPLRPAENAVDAVPRILDQALREGEGDVLVFLPGRGEIARITARLQRHPPAVAVQVLSLHGEMDLARQSAVLSPDPDGRRRVVLATNVAESSLTLPGVRAVIDTGLAREPRLDAHSGFSRLVTVNVSAASAAQRAGRAGRLGPGRCYRLWPESLRLEPQTRPEIAQVDLAGLCLELAAWGASDLPFLDPPPPGHLAQARQTLQALAALDGDGTVTALGRRMLGFGCHPRLAAMMLPAGRDQGRDTFQAGDHALAADLAALLDGRDPLQGEAARDDRIESRWRQLAAFRRDGRASADARREVLAALRQQAGHWHRRLGGGPVPDSIDSHRLGNLLLAAWPDRIARRQSGDRYTLANGRGARLAPDSALRGQPWLVIAQLRYDPRDSLIQLAAPFDPGQLQQRFPQHFHTAEQARFDPDTQSVAVFREQRFMDLVLERQRLAQVDPAQRLAGLLDGLRQLGLAALPWTPALEQWLARVRCLGQWCPEPALPDFSDSALLASLEHWLAPFLAGKPRLSALTAGDLANALQARLDYGQQQALAQLAPASLAVPSGRQLRLHYEPGQAPVLPVKLQEMFGSTDTPTVAGGKVPVLLHLLSPAQRPIQVTADLAGFWQRTYPEVKKELKGRYPRHPWPDDPWSAQPDHRTKAAQARARSRPDPAG